MSLDEKSDVELVQLFRSGDMTAFDAIVRRFEGRIYRLASVWLYDPQQAVDATQEVFLRSVKGLRGFRFRSAPFTWLYRMTRNVCHELNRRRRNEPLLTEPVDTSPETESLIAEHQTAAKVRDLVASLPQRQREVVMLRIFEDLTVSETAHAMGCREGTVKALLHKATARLKIKYEAAANGGHA